MDHLLTPSITLVSVNVGLWTVYKTQNNGIQYPLPTFYVNGAFSSNDGRAEICEVLAFSSRILLDTIFQKIAEVQQEDNLLP